MLQPYQESLDNTITKIKSNKILLPNFQRQFVWKDEIDQKKLVASVLTKMPIGSILLLKAKNAKEYACKPLGSRRLIDPSELCKGSVEFLLDGQQRLTVLANVFSNVIFSLSSIGDLISPNALKKRFFLALPRYGVVSDEEDLFGLNKLAFPLDKPDNDDPSFQTTDIFEYIITLPFSKNSKNCYNPYNKKTTTLSKLESFCQNPEEDYYYIPLFLLIDNGKTKLNNTTLTRIINAIAGNIAQAKIDELNKIIAEGRKDIKEIIKSNLLTDAYEEYFDEDCYDEGYDAVLEAYGNVLRIQADGWASSMLLYLKSCIAQINLSQISLDDSQRARAIDIYENLNRGGVSLDIYDLLMARVTLANPEPYSTRIKNYIDKASVYPQALIPDGIKNDFKKLKKYKASAVMECYYEDKNEFVKNYLDTFLNVLSLLSYRSEFTKTAITVDLIKRDKKLSLTPQQIDDNCAPSCEAIDRACFFFQCRCGIRKFKELNYILMVPVVAYILHDDECYSGKYGEEVFNLLEAWYWTSIFSGQFDRDQNSRMITDLNFLIENVLSIKEGHRPNLNWLISRNDKVLAMPGYSDKQFLLMENALNDEYPKAILSTVICQYYLSRGYNDLLKNADGSLRHMSVFAECSDKYQIHHVIPLGTDCMVSDSTNNIRKDKKNILNSPLNKLFITSFTNNKISDKPVDTYVKIIPKGAGLTNVGFTTSNISLDASEEEKKEVLRQRYDALLDAVLKELTYLVDFSKY